MPVPSTLASLSTTPGSNSPGGGENPFPELDDHIRQGYAFTAQLRDQKLNSSAVSAYMLTVLDDANAGAARTTLGAVGNTGNETIAGVKTFSSAPVSSAAASAANELMRKGEVDSAVSTAAATKADLAGSASQVFSVAAATAVDHAVRLGQFLAGVSSGELSISVPCTGLPGGATSLIVKAGRGTYGAGGSLVTVSASFNAAFPNACLAFIPVQNRTPATTQAHVLRGDATTSGFTVFVTDVSVNNVAASGYDWIAVGY